MNDPINIDSLEKILAVAKLSGETVVTIRQAPCDEYYIHWGGVDYAIITRVGKVLLHKFEELK